MKQQNYNDGILSLLHVCNVAAPGDMPRDGLECKVRLRFERRTVGVARYNKALANGVKVEELLRCPRREDVSTQDIAVVQNKQYRIARIQYPLDAPTSMDMELSRLEHDYAV